MDFSWMARRSVYSAAFGILGFGLHTSLQKSPEKMGYRLVEAPEFPGSTRFYEKDLATPFSAECKRGFWGQPSSILYSKQMKEKDAAAWRFVMLHEIGHAKDPISDPLYLATAFFITEFCFWRFKPPRGAFLNAIGILATRFLFSRAQERWADFYAREHATVEELNGGIRFFEQLDQLKGGKHFWFDAHPPLRHRIKRIAEKLTESIV